MQHVVFIEAKSVSKFFPSDGDIPLNSRGASPATLPAYPAETLMVAVVAYTCPSVSKGRPAISLSGWTPSLMPWKGPRRLGAQHGVMARGRGSLANATGAGAAARGR